MAAADAGEVTQAPKSPMDIFLGFTMLALQGFGGVVVVVQRELVERRRWMTRNEFLEDWAVAQVLPGPNVVNLGLMLGSRYFGWRGALASLLGLVLFPMFLVLGLGLVYGHFQDSPAVAGALRGMAAVAAGLIIATGLKLLPALRQHPLGMRMALVVAGLSFAMIGVLRWPLISVLLGLGTVACVLTWRKLAP